MLFTRVFKVLLIAIIAFAFATVATAYAAANTVPATNAGDGSGTITGYVVSAVHYTLDATTPSNVTAVTFTLAPNPAATATVKIQLDGATWSTCAPAAGEWTCTVTGVTALSAVNLRVVAAQ